MADMPLWLADQVDAARREHAEALASLGFDAITGRAGQDRITPRST